MSPEISKRGPPMIDKPSKLEELAADHWESSRDPGAKHPHIWQAFAELTQAVAAEVARIDRYNLKSTRSLFDHFEERFQRLAELANDLDNGKDGSAMGRIRIHEQRLAEIERRLGPQGQE